MWILWAAFAFFVLRRWSRWGRWHSHRRYALYYGPPWVFQGQGHRMMMQPERTLSPKEQRDRALSDARRRYVADEITVEEYEQELDRVLRA